MKKYIYLIFAALSALLLLFACREEKPVEVKKPELKVVSSDVIFGVEGGEGTIVVEADAAVTVTSERPWVQTSVNGNEITVTVSEPNLNPQSRYSRLTITAGSEKTYVTVHQFGEIFDGMKMEDVTVAREGTTMRYAFKANMTVNVSTDQPWVHCALDEENDGIMILTVDENTDFGVRYATVSYTAGSNSGSMKVTQNPKFGAVSGWTVANTGGRFEFPDQIDEITVTPPSDMAEAYYLFHIASVDEFPATDVDAAVEEACLETGAAIRAALASGEIQSVGEIALKGKYVEEYPNLPSASKAFISCFDEAGYPTGQYAFIDVAIPDRGPVKEMVEGWDIEHVSGKYLPSGQKDEFTVTPRAGFEDKYYLVSAVKNSDVSNIEDYAFTTFAIEAREAILSKVASGELSSFEEGLSKGTSTHSFMGLSGDVTVVVVVFGDNKFYTGEYGTAEFAVGNLKRTHWLGEWSMTNAKDQNYTWTLVDKDDDSGDFRMFCNGLYTGTGSLLKSITWFDVRYNESDGSITVFAQTHPDEDVYYNATYGDIYAGLFGFYDSKSDGKTYYRTAVPYDLFTLSLTDDGVVTITKPGAYNDQEFHSFKVYYWSKVKEARFSFTSNQTLYTEGLTLTRE